MRGLENGLQWNLEKGHTNNKKKKLQFAPKGHCKGLDNKGTKLTQLRRKRSIMYLHFDLMMVTINLITSHTTTIIVCEIGYFPLL